MVDEKKRWVGRRVLLGGAAAAAAGAVSYAGTGYAEAHPLDRVGTPTNPSELVPSRPEMDVAVGRLERDLIALRRDIHRHPELAGRERRTAALVASRLRAAGLQVTTNVGGHGVVGVLRGTRPGRTIAYRADMDAVGPSDQFGGGDEAAHLCGHDIHTTVGVGVAEVLARLRRKLAGTVVFVFQPAEENLTGAAAMLRDGVLELAGPSEIHALHCGPFPVGHVAVTGGYGLPGLDRGTIELTGPDAVGRAERLAAEIGKLGTVTQPETPAALERLVSDIQTPNGPLRRFVFMRAAPAGDPGTDRAEVSLSYRCWPAERYTVVRERVGRLAAADGAASVRFPEDPFPAMFCPEQEGRAVERHLRSVAGPDRVARLHAAIPFSGEDFALFLQRIPGTYTFLGVRTPGAELQSSYPHFGAFRPDERAIRHGVGMMAGWLAARAAST